MSSRLQEITRRRRLLVARASEQRGAFALQAGALRQYFGFADLTWRGYRLLMATPLTGILAAAALVVIGPGRLLRLGYRSGLLVVGLLRLMRIFRALR
jgi:hypothetical protein